MLIHGAGAGGWEWRIWKAVLEAAGIATASPDLQPAAAGLADTGLAEYVAQMSAALAALPRPRAVIGASLGGLIAAHLAQTDGVMDALVMVNPLPPAPWHTRLPDRDWPNPVPWGTHARLTSTRRALPDADAATCVCAFRRWRDESGAVLRQARAGIAMAPPNCALLCIASARDEEVPAQATHALAEAWGGTVLPVPGASHVGPLLGRSAAWVAAQVCAWLSAR